MKKKDTFDHLCTLTEAAERIGLSLGRTIKIARMLKLPMRKFGQAIVISRNDIPKINGARKWAPKKRAARTNPSARVR